jgi:cell division transport system ATP-binding protein
LDRNYADDIMQLFGAFQQVGVTVIVATHDALGKVTQADKILHLNQGTLETSPSDTNQQAQNELV